MKHRDFREVSSISLASFGLRQSVLKSYFSTFCPRSARHWTRCCHIPGFFSWVRSVPFCICHTSCMRIFLTICAHICSILDSLTTALGSKPAFLANFTYLQTLELDFSDDGLATQSQRAELLTQFLPATLTVIRLVCLPRIDPHILGLIAARCPVLETLDVTTLERLDLSCCWVCLEESSTCTVHSPIPDMYSDVKELSVAFDTSHLRSSRGTDGRFSGRSLSQPLCSLSSSCTTSTWASVFLTLAFSTHIPFIGRDPVRVTSRCLHSPRTSVSCVPRRAMRCG